MSFLLGQYVEADSVVHRLDPRVKIVSTVMLSLLILGASAPHCLASALLLGLVMHLTRIPFRAYLKAFRPVIPFFALLFLLHLLFTPGTPLPPFGAWAITVTKEGLLRGGLVVFRFGLLVFAASLLTYTTLPSDLVFALERLLRPLKALGVPSHDVAVMVFLALRFFPVFLRELERLREAQAARGRVVRGGSLGLKIHAATDLLVPLAWSTLRKADTLAAAMEARGYGSGPRTYMRTFSLSFRDYAALFLLLLLAAWRLLCGIQA